MIDKKGVTIKDIQNYLAECELNKVSVLTIRRDIERLEICGCKIKVTHGAHNIASYKMQNKGFTFNEI